MGNKENAKLKKIKKKTACKKQKKPDTKKPAKNKELYAIINKKSGRKRNKKSSVA